MVQLTPAQERNLRAALAAAPNDAMRVRLAFAIWTESKALIYANGGLNTSRSPGFDRNPQWPGILRRSLTIPHDAVGNNGRSVGMLQQIPGEVGGVWGPMAGCMDPATSAKQFLVHLRVTDNPIFTGTLQTPTGTERVNVLLSDPIAADVLRVQQPLASEARSPNYNAAQVAVARALVAQLFPPTNPDPDPVEDDFVATQKYVHIRFTLNHTQACVWHVLDMTWSKIPDEAGANQYWFDALKAVLGDSVERWENIPMSNGNDAADPANFGREIPFN